MNLTPEIKEAIRKAIDLHGNVTQFAKHLGIAHSTVLFWLSGKTTEVSGRLWAQKLRPSLLPFLGASAFANQPLSKSFFSAKEEMASYGSSSTVQTRVESPVAESHLAPLISFEQVSNFDPAIEPIGSYAKSCANGNASFANEVKEGYFALKVASAFSCDAFPAGSALLVAGGEYPQSDDTVVAKIRSSGKVVVRVYKRAGTLIKLESLGAEGNFEWDCKENPGFLDWMYPVFEVNMNLRTKKNDASEPAV